MRARGSPRGGLGLGAGIDPAGVNPVVQALLHLVVDLRTKSGQAAERGLDMPAGAAEPVVKVEVAKGGVEVVAPHQANDAPAQPNAFRVSRRTVDRLRRFDEFIGLALAVLGGIGRTGGRLAGLIRGGRVPLWASALPIPIMSASPGTARWRKTAI